MHTHTSRIKSDYGFNTGYAICIHTHTQTHYRYAYEIVSSIAKRTKAATVALSYTMLH